MANQLISRFEGGAIMVFRIVLGIIGCGFLCFAAWYFVQEAGKIGTSFLSFPAGALGIVFILLAIFNKKGWILTENTNEKPPSASF
jgi:hypothetical protein